jgi:phosphoribosylglycinamide formyltransferase-1
MTREKIMDNVSRLVVLISGNGSNLQAILDATARGELPARVVGVISNKADAYGLIRAAKAGVPTFVLSRAQEPDRRAYDAVLAGYVGSYRPDYVVLAGWMRILTSAFLDRFPNRVINLHPALPGTFPGTHAIERAYEAWQKGEIDRSGVMVHLVPDEGVDVGPVLGAQEIHFQAGESLEQFEARVHEVEHRLLVETLKTVLAKKVTKQREGKSG